MRLDDRITWTGPNSGTYVFIAVWVIGLIVAAILRSRIERRLGEGSAAVGFILALGVAGVAAVKGCDYIDTRWTAVWSEAADPFGEVLSELIDLGMQTADQAPHPGLNVGRFVWIHSSDLSRFNINERSTTVAQSFAMLPDGLRARTPQDIQTVCFSTESLVWVGNYSDNSGSAYRADVKVWCVDYFSKTVVARTNFQADPPPDHSVRPGEVRHQYGEVSETAIKSWLETLPVTGSN